MGRQEEPRRPTRGRESFEAPPSSRAPTRRAAADGPRNADDDYLKRGKGGRRNWGFLLVLLVHWVVIAGLIFGMPTVKPAADVPPIEVADVPTEPEAQPEPPLDVPEPPKKPPVELLFPVPEFPLDRTEPSPSAPQGAPAPTPGPRGPDVPVQIDPRYPPSKPDYPASSKRLNQQGSVALLLLVGPDGRVIEARIERGSGYPALDEAALRAARTWRFKPAQTDGKPVAAWYRTTVRFELEGA